MNNLNSKPSFNINEINKILDEVFVVSKKPRLSLVQSNRAVKCTVMLSGPKKINMDYFFCKTCDKEHKLPICKYCIETCHNNHTIIDHIEGSDDNLVICMCGYKNHLMNKKDNNKYLNEEEFNTIKCNFHQLSLASEVYDYYIGKDGIKICVFCYHFCCQNLISKEELDENRNVDKIQTFQEYNFRRVHLTKEEFEYGLINGDIICDCLNLINSKHRSQEHLSMFINQLNIPLLNEEYNIDYFSELTPVHLVNKFFNCIELFENIYNGFISEYNDFLSTKESNIHQNLITHNFSMGYFNFANNAKNCKYNFYFSEKINVYFTPKITNIILETNLNFSEQTKLFVVSFLTGFYIFRLGSYFESIPRYKLTDIINFNPYQRKLFISNAQLLYSTCGLGKENIPENLINVITKISYMKPEFNEVADILTCITRIIKLYAKFFLIQPEYINNISKALIDLFGYLSLYKTFPSNRIINYKKAKAKILKHITKTLVYFTFVLNDEAFFNLVNEGNPSLTHEITITNKKFFHSFSENSKSLSKLFVHVVDYVREEYEATNKIIKENKTHLNEENELTDMEYLISLIRLMYTNQIIIDLLLNEKDCYIPILKRTINAHLNYYMTITSVNYIEDDFIKKVNEKVKTLEHLYFDYFNVQSIKMHILEEYINSFLPNITKDIFNDNPNSETFDIIEHRLIQNENNIFTSSIKKSNYRTYPPIINLPPSIQIPKQFLLNKSNILYSITKIFLLSKDKSVYSDALCENIITFCFSYIADNEDNCSLGLSSPILYNLSKIPRQYLCCALDYLLYGIKIFILNKTEIPFCSHYAKFAFIYYTKSTSQSKRNNFKFLPNFPLCLYKLLKLFLMLIDFKCNDKDKFIGYIKPHLIKLANNSLIKTYKKYLLNISNDYKQNKDTYIHRKAFDKKELFMKYYKKEVSFYSMFDMELMFKIFLRFMSLLNKTFDAGALETIDEIIIKFFSLEDLSQILSITTLNISLRLELLKYFRMIYIDIGISLDKLDNYRYIFQKQLNKEADNLRNNVLIPYEKVKVFLFLQNLLKIEEYSLESKENTYVFDLLLNELKNVQEIISYSKTMKKKVYLSYVENGILLPIEIYLNKFFSMVLTIKKENIEKLSEFCLCFLQMKEFIISSKIINIRENFAKTIIKHEDNNNNNSQFVEDKIYLRNSLIKDDMFIRPGSLAEIREDISKITNQGMSSELSYIEIYEILNKHIMSLIDNPTSQELVLYFSEYEKFEENEKFQIKKEKMKKGIDINNVPYCIVWNIYEKYIHQKTNLDLSSIKSIFDETFLDSETTYRSVITKYLLFLSNNKLEAFSTEAINMLLKLLKHETTKTQEAIAILAQSIVKSGALDLSGSKQQIEELYNLATQGFDCVLSTIYGQYNPTSLELPDDYKKACLIIKVFKFLCEEHNHFFQHRLICEIALGLNNGDMISKISFFDIMLFMADKIITVSSWENPKTKDEVQDYFYGVFFCIIEMLIEIIQGSEQHNFDVFDFDIERKDTSTNIYPQGEALRIFLVNIKGILFNNEIDSDILFCIRKDLMEFLLAFLEEYNCPRKIKNLIMSYYHPSLIIKSICDVLKKFYLNNLTHKNDLNYNETQSMKFKRQRTNIIIDHTLFVNNNETNNISKSKHKRLKRLKFNQTLYEAFIKLYFEDPDFGNTKVFELCNAFYRYFILTYAQYKNEETMNYYNKVHSISESSLHAYNERTKLTDEETITLKRKSKLDDSDFEAFYVIKFFKEISKHILVKIKPNLPPVYVVYTIHPYSAYLSADSKSDFLRTVDRHNRNAKLYALTEASEFFMLEIIYNWENLRKNSLLKLSTKLNYHLLGYIAFIVSFALNFVLLSCLHESGESYYGNNTINIVYIISYVYCGVLIIISIFWFKTKFKLYYIIEEAKYKEQKNNKGNKETILTCYDLFKIKLKAIMEKGELNAFFISFVFTLMGSVNRNLMFLYAFSLLSIISLAQTLINFMMSIASKSRSLLSTLIFTLVLLYVYAGWGFYYQRDRFYEINGRDKPEQMCKSLLYCFLTHINNGLRWHAGIGRIVRSESALLYPVSFFHRFIYDLLFFWLMEGVMLRSIFGIILESFTEIRERQYVIDRDISCNCFICDVEKDECEKNDENFQEHCNSVHNIWDYAFYMVTLRMKDPQELNAVDTKNREMILKKQLGWFPEYNNTNKDEDIK